MNTIRHCVGGPWERTCITYGQHTQDCEHDTCRGCAPRQATEGFLCLACDTRLRQWLAVTTVTRTPEGHPINGHVPGCDRSGHAGCEYAPNSLLWVDWWLGMSQSARITRAPRWDSGRGGSSDLASPLSEAILSARQQLRHVVEATECKIRERLGQEPAHMPRFELTEAMAYLARHVIQLEDHHDQIQAAWYDLSALMVEAHTLAPWRAERRRIAHVPCPTCERKRLVIFGGDDFVTCLECGTVITSTRFDIWSEIDWRGDGQAS